MLTNSQIQQKIVKVPIRPNGYFQPFLSEIRISQHCKLAAAAASSFRIAKYYYTADYISKENKVLDELSDLAKGQSTLVLVTILEDNQTTKNISQTKERRHFPKAPYFQQDELFHRDDNAVSLEFDVLHKFWQWQKHWNLWHIFCIFCFDIRYVHMYNQLETCAKVEQWEKEICKVKRCHVMGNFAYAVLKWDCKHARFYYCFTFTIDLKIDQHFWNQHDALTREMSQGSCEVWGVKKQKKKVCLSALFFVMTT